MYEGGISCCYEELLSPQLIKPERWWWSCIQPEYHSTRLYKQLFLAMFCIWTGIQPVPLHQTIQTVISSYVLYMYIQPVPLHKTIQTVISSYVLYMDWCIQYRWFTNGWTSAVGSVEVQNIYNLTGFNFINFISFSNKLYKTVFVLQKKLTFKALFK